VIDTETRHTGDKLYRQPPPLAS